MFAASLASRRVTPLARSLLSANMLKRTASAAVADRFQYNPIDAQKKFRPSHSHATMFKLERYLAAAMIPLLPAAYYIHNPTMDMVLAASLTLHIHWGIHGVLTDYGRPYVLGPGLAKFVQGPFAYLLSVSLLAGLLHFNMYDVGITKAFEMVWSL